MTNFKKTRWESAKYRKAAQGEDCKMRLPGCRNDTSTVVLAHRNGAGVGMKADDHNAADMCDHCHSIFDGRSQVHAGYEKEELRDREFELARLATILNRIERGILK